MDGSFFNMSLDAKTKEPKRVLLVLGKLDRGGAETMVMNYYRHIDRNQLQFDFVVHSNHIGAYEKEIRFLGGKIYHIPRFRVYNLFSYQNAWKKLSKGHQEYHVIHAHMASTACLFIPIAKHYGITTIVHAHNSKVSGSIIKQILEKISFYPLKYMADYFFACSDEAGIYKFGKAILRNRNYRIWYNAIDLEGVKYSEEKRRKTRDILHIDDDTFLIGNVGRLTPPKNHKFILDIFYSFIQHHHNSKLLLLGDGELRNSLEQYVQELHLQNSVIFTGSVNNVSDYLSAMDIFLFPSLYEGLGMAVVEAQVAGLYCLVSTEVPRAAEICRNIEFIPLKGGVIDWCKKMELAPKIDRNKINVQNDDYNIKKAAKRAEKFYLSLY